MAGFISVMPVPGTTSEGQTVRPAINLTRYCPTKNCRNGIRLSSDDKLCEQCLVAGSVPVSNSVKNAPHESGSLQLPRTSCGVSPAPVIRDDRCIELDRCSFSPALAEMQTDPHSTHLAMLDERQQNRARKLERETEEVNGRWRTRQSAANSLGSSPPRSSRSRKPATDRAVMVDTYRPNGRNQPHGIDHYRPGKDSLAHPSHLVDVHRLYEMVPQRNPGPEKLPATDLASRPGYKRKFEEETAHSDVSNKSLVNPGQSTRCGKRNCGKVAMIGKDRCESCYRAEGRHPGDERRRCASSDCTRCIADAIKGDLCRICLEKEPGDSKPNICTRTLCRNTLPPGIPGLPCSDCQRLKDPARHCKAYRCNILLPKDERGDHCKNHAPAKKISTRVCIRPYCNNTIALNLEGKLCRVCLTYGSTRPSVGEQNMADSGQGHLSASEGLPVYRHHQYSMPYNYCPPQQSYGQLYHQGLHDHPYHQILQGPSFQQPFQAELSYNQPQHSISPQLYFEQPQQFQYHAQQLMMAQSPMQQPPDRYHDYRGQFVRQPRQVDGHCSSFLAHHFQQGPVPRLSSPSVYRGDYPAVSSALSFDDKELSVALSAGTQPPDSMSRIAHRHGVREMHRMLKAPCLGCLQELGEKEASTHPQIYCVHLPSKVRHAVLLDYEQWKHMCASKQEANDGDVDSEFDPSDQTGPGATTSIKREEQGSLSPASASTKLQLPANCELSSTTVPDVLRPLSPRHSVKISEQTEYPEQDGVSPGSDAPPAPPSTLLAFQSLENKAESVAEPSDQCPSRNVEPSGVSISEMPKRWAADSIRELLELRRAAEPGTPLEVAVGLQQELRNCLLLDVTEGDPQDGEPSAIGLLRVLDQRVEDLRERLADG